MTPRQAFVKILLNLYEIRKRYGNGPSSLLLPDLIKIAGKSDPELLEEILTISEDLKKVEDAPQDAAL